MVSLYNRVLPNNYNGYLIQTDYRIGIKITLILEDSEIEEDERALQALTLLYGLGIPEDPEVAVAGLVWFLRGGKSEDEIADLDDVDEAVSDLLSKDEELFDEAELKGLDKAYDFDLDSDLIYACFNAQYGIDLGQTEMHWFKFISLFKGLKDTQLNDLMYYRTVDITKLPKEQRAEVRKIQETNRIRKVSKRRREMLEAVYGTEWRKHI